jgi:hypothetical protein
MQQLHVHRPSTIGTILAASGISGQIVLGELAGWVLQWWGLPEHVTMVQADNHIMFHWVKHPGGPGDLRADTATYQWVGRWCRVIVANPYALLPDKKGRKHHIGIIGKVEPHSPKYLTTEYLRLPLKYVPSTAPNNKSGIRKSGWILTFHTPRIRSRLT